MITQVGQDDLLFLLRRHADLEAKYGDGDGGRFLSGWQCDNPYSGEIRRAVDRQIRQIDSGQYLYLNDDPTLHQAIRKFHRSVDDVMPDCILCGAGASSLIFTFCAWLRIEKIEEVYYIPPLYFSLHFALRLFGIRARPISGKHAFEDGFSINLPSAKTILLLADPIWYAGISLPLDLVGSLVDWQARTGSLVFVDGSFQYANWNGLTAELTSQFKPEKTARLVCPTKSLASHGYRFAYVLLPESMRTTCAHVYASIYGSTNFENLAFARFALSVMDKLTITQPLMGQIAKRHKSLRARGAISAPWQPNCGYFIFEKIVAKLPPDTLLMDGSYFEQKRYPHYYRINLLSPMLHILG